MPLLVMNYEHPISSGRNTALGSNQRTRPNLKFLLGGFVSQDYYQYQFCIDQHPNRWEKHGNLNKESLIQKMINYLQGIN